METGFPFYNVHFLHSAPNLTFTKLLECYVRVGVRL